MDRAMNQGFVAHLLGCTEQTVRFWEQDKYKPRSQQVAKLIEFLGYDPLPEATEIGGQLIRYRQYHGLTQRGLAWKLEVDPSSIWAWETGEHRPNSKSMLLIKQLLGE